MRKLASLQKILAVHPIENADAIELVQINGWQCVVKKGEFKVGDYGVYLEIDAVPPIEGPYSGVFSFLWKNSLQPAANFRIKTKKLRGALSQGLMLHTDLFPIELLKKLGNEGDDWTEALGVTKYEPPVGPAGRGQQCGNFPCRVPKTDETRIQSEPWLLNRLMGKPYSITLKCDGSSGTFTVEDDKFLVCSRNYIIMEGDNVYWRVAAKYNLETALRENANYALQGEVVGPGIQKNKMGLKDVELRAFSLFDKERQMYLPQSKLEQFCMQYNIPFAPVIEVGESFKYTLPELLTLAEGLYESTKNEREGIVVRRALNLDEVFCEHLSFKVISNKFLLKESD